MLLNATINLQRSKAQNLKTASSSPAQKADRIRHRIIFCFKFALPTSYQKQTFELSIAFGRIVLAPTSSTRNRGYNQHSTIWILAAHLASYQIYCFMVRSMHTWPANMTIQHTTQVFGLSLEHCFSFVETPNTDRIWVVLSPFPIGNVDCWSTPTIMEAKWYNHLSVALHEYTRDQLHAVLPWNQSSYTKDEAKALL